MIIYVHADIHINAYVCIHTYICVGIDVCVFLSVEHLAKGCFMKTVTTGSGPCLLLLYRRFLNSIINFFGI